MLKVWYGYYWANGPGVSKTVFILEESQPPPKNYIYISLSFLASRGHPQSLATHRPSFFIFKASNAISLRPLFHIHISLWLSSLAILLNSEGYLWLHWSHLDNPGKFPYIEVSLFVNLIPSVNSPLPYNLT